jgi:hypothetical protein
MTQQVDHQSFPSKPDVLTFKSVTKFAKLSQLALASITDLDRPYLHLPLISPHILQEERFEVDEDKVFVIQRKSYVDLIGLLNHVDRAKYSGIFLR